MRLRQMKDNTKEKIEVLFKFSLIIVTLIFVIFIGIRSTWNSKYLDSDLQFRRDIIREAIEFGMTPKSMTIMDHSYVKKYNEEVLKFRDLNENDLAGDSAINDSSLATLPVFVYEKNKWLEIK